MKSINYSVRCGVGLLVLVFDCVLLGCIVCWILILISIGIVGVWHVHSSSQLGIVESLYVPAFVSV